MSMETIWLYTGFLVWTALAWVFSAFLFYVGVEVFRKGLRHIKSYRLMNQYIMEHKEDFLKWVIEKGELKIPERP